MANSSPHAPLGIARSTAVISLGLVALAGSITTTLCRRMITALTRSDAPTPKISTLVMDEWEADLAQLKLPSRSEVEAMQQQIAELETQIDQLIQHAAQPQAGD